MEEPNAAVECELDLYRQQTNSRLAHSPERACGTGIAQQKAALGRRHPMRRIAVRGPRTEDGVARRACDQMVRAKIVLGSEDRRMVLVLVGGSAACAGFVYKDRPTRVPRLRAHRHRCRA